MYSHGNGLSKQYCLGDCLYLRCDTEEFPLDLTVIDSEKEARMQLGRSWPYERIPDGQVAITSDAAKAVKVETGDTLYVQFSSRQLLKYGFAPDNSVPNPSSGEIPTPTSDAPRAPNFGWAERVAYHSSIVFPVKVFAVMDQRYGKVGSNYNGIFMEYDTFGSYLTTRLHPLIRHNASDPFTATATPNLYHTATTMAVNLPPTQRLDSYLSSNYDEIQNDVAGFASEVVYLTDFPQTDTDLPVLTSVRRNRFTTLYVLMCCCYCLFVCLFVLFV